MISKAIKKPISKMGAHRRSKILVLLFLAALVFAAARLWSWSSSRISTSTLDELYRLLDWALWFVIVGVIIEEWKLIWKIAKFVSYSWNGRFCHAVARAWHYRGELAEGLGFGILVIGLAAEMALDPSIEATQKAIEAKAEGELTSQKAATANALAAAGAAQLAQERIKQAVQWREISLEQIEILGKELAKSGGTVRMAFLLGDLEIELFCFRLWKGFESANNSAAGTTWVGTISGRTYSNVLYFGVIIPGPATPQVVAIRQAFDAADIPFSIEDVAEPDPPFPPGGILTLRPSPNKDALILVGLRVMP